MSLLFLYDGNSVLQVCHVKEIDLDPFISLGVVFSVRNVDGKKKMFVPAQPHLFGPYVLYQTQEMEASDNEKEEEKEESEKEKQEEEKKENGQKEIDLSNPDNVPPEVYKKTKNWWWNKQVFIKKFGLSKVEQCEKDKMDEEQRKQAEMAKAKKEAMARRLLKKGAEYVLVNYEMKNVKKVEFPLFPYGWRLLGVKVANHSYWVLTLYSQKKLMDVVLQLSL